MNRPIQWINYAFFAYSELIDFDVDLTLQIVVAFPEETVLGGGCTIVHCVAIEFLEPNGSNGYRTRYGASVEIMYVFYDSKIIYNG